MGSASQKTERHRLGKKERRYTGTEPRDQSHWPCATSCEPSYILDFTGFDFTVKHPRHPSLPIYKLRIEDLILEQVDCLESHQYGKDIVHMIYTIYPIRDRFRRRGMRPHPNKTFIFMENREA